MIRRKALRDRSYRSDRSHRADHRGEVRRPHSGRTSGSSGEGQAACARACGRSGGPVRKTGANHLDSKAGVPACLDVASSLAVDAQTVDTVVRMSVTVAIMTRPGSYWSCSVAVARRTCSICHPRQQTPSEICPYRAPKSWRLRSKDDLLAKFARGLYTNTSAFVPALPPIPVLCGQWVWEPHPRGSWYHEPAPVTPTADASIHVDAMS